MMDNVSVVSVFTLSGVGLPTNSRALLFVLTVLCYCVIWLLNMTIIVTIIIDKRLHEPMYIFLCNLCINGLYGTAGFYPKFLKDLLSSVHVISYAGCLLQGFVLHSSVCADLSLLLLMAFDRYVAICQPLIYNSVMTRERICIFLTFAWFIPLYLVFVGTITTSMLKLCGSHIPKLYCINFFIGKLACTPSSANVIVPAFNYTVYLLHFTLIFFSYVYLIKKCLHSSENRGKFIQTCLPHVVCLSAFITAVAFDLLYVRFGQSDLPLGVKNFMAMEFLLIPPIINPLIYGLKLTQIRQRIVNSFFKRCYGAMRL